MMRRRGERAMANDASDIDPHLFVENLIYWPDYGIFTHRKKGIVIGSMTGDAYVKVSIRNPRDHHCIITVSAHRLAWYFLHKKWPDQLIDHKNGLRFDNREINLRSASHRENVTFKRRGVPISVDTQANIGRAFYGHLRDAPTKQEINRRAAAFWSKKQ